MKLDKIPMCEEDSIHIPKWQCSIHKPKETPFEIMPVATIVVAIGLLISIVYLIHINW